MKDDIKNMQDYENYKAECFASDTTPIPYEDFVELYTEDIYLID